MAQQAITRYIAGFGDVPTWTVGEVVYFYYPNGKALYTYDPGTTAVPVLYQPNVRSEEDAEAFIS